jgi:hypothetical protein
MKNAKAITTQVYELPSDEVARKSFLDGITALAEQFNAKWVAGSVHNEIDYADLLAQELTEHVGELAVENIRQEFERK